MCVPLNVMGAARLPFGVGDWRSLNLNRDIFLHSSVPKKWWSEYATMVRREFDPGIMMARQSIMAFTWTETRRMLDPIGVDQWPYEVALKYGIRDALTCPVGRRLLLVEQADQRKSDSTASHPVAGCGGFYRPAPRTARRDGA
jgi:hypothetical protein